MRSTAAEVSEFADGEQVWTDQEANRPRQVLTDPLNPPTFVMVSYQQAWCKGRWATMGAVLHQLVEQGWEWCWLDVCVIDPGAPYVQANFEAAMYARH